MATTSSFFSLLDHNNLDVRSSFPSFSSRRSYDFSPQILQTWIFSFLCTRTVLEREIRWYHQSSSSSLWRSWEREEEVPLSKSQGCFIPLWSLLWVMRHSNSSSLFSFFLSSSFFLLLLFVFSPLTSISLSLLLLTWSFHLFFSWICRETYRSWRIHTLSLFLLSWLSCLPCFIPVSFRWRRVLHSIVCLLLIDSSTREWH